MNDEAIRDVLLQILHVGLLRIRAAGFGGKSEVCAREADHLHNLPGLARSLDRGELRYYFSAERQGFVRTSTLPTDDFVPLWNELGKLLGNP